jgi:hypothetical protein
VARWFKMPTRALIKFCERIGFDVPTQNIWQ